MSTCRSRFRRPGRASRPSSPRGRPRRPPAPPPSMRGNPRRAHRGTTYPRPRLAAGRGPQADSEPALACCRLSQLLRSLVTAIVPRPWASSRASRPTGAGVVADHVSTAAPRTGTGRMRSGQRGANGQPGGRLISWAAPGIGVSRWPLPPWPAARPAALGVRVVVAVEHVRRGARSITAPAYITTTSSAISATTPRSWVIRMIAVPNSLLQPAHHVQHLGLHGHVERGGRLVRDQQGRVERHRHRDHHPLPHPAGELVRIVVDPLRRPGDADQSEQVGGPLPGRLWMTLSCARIISTICQPTR